MTRMRVVPHRVLASALALALTLRPPAIARADPYRLRIDSVAYTQSPQSPVGLIVLQGDDQANKWVDAEALAWAGNRNGSYDVLSAMVRLHDPRNYAELRLGRQMITVGALRPVHFDGVDARLRSPTGTSLEAFGGLPAVPQFGYGAYDWLAGGRLAQHFGPKASLGVSYLQQREDGRLSSEEAGLDFAASPVRWFDLAAHGAYALIDPGLAEAGASLAGRFGDLRPEIYATHRSPSRLIPATSLFSALGDTPSDVVGASLKWRMFPRLDVLPVLAARETAGDVGVDGTLRVTLRLDDRGEGALSVEARRQGSGTDRWTGARITTRVPLSPRVRASTELELVAPDDPRGRGALWPWGLVALHWVPVSGWDLAGAVEAASTPSAVRELNALARVSFRWERGPGR
jgi:hypothetical protein